MALQNRVRELRAVTFRGEVSQMELARRAGIDPSTLSDIENNRTSPSMETGLALARLFGCSIEDLFLPSATDAVSVNSPSADRLAGRSDAGDRSATDMSSGDRGPVASSVGAQAVENSGSVS